ncbi:MAG: formate--tetrahydrofolate ligase, partial [Gammaproteobacteria bacterium]
RQPTFVYPTSAPLWEKMRAIATKIYGAKDISASSKVRAEIDKLNETYGDFPVCIAKTQMSFSTDPGALGAPSGHTVEIREVRLSAGARFIVAIAGNMMTMPGLPKVPAAEHIDIDASGNIVGLF